MGLPYGIVAAAVQLGVEAILVKPKRGIGPFSAHVTISERHADDLEIVDHPVEQGAQVSDHAYKRPPEVTIECAWSNSPGAGAGLVGGLVNAVSGTVGGVASILSGSSPGQVRDVYANLLALQASVQLMDVYTGKRVYRDMLVKSLLVETDKDTENVLRVTAVLRQVFIASVRVVTIGAPAGSQADPQSTVPPLSKGVKQLAPAAKNFNLRAAIDSLTPSPSTLIRGLLP